MRVVVLLTHVSVIQYYSCMDLTEEEILDRLGEVCRHRAVKQPMETPPNFWNMSIATLDD